MRGTFRKTIPAAIISFAISFMLFFYEPITMYANNINDFWFDFYILIKPTLLFFAASFIIILVFFTIIYFITKHFKRPNIYYFTLLFFTFCFVCAYIHGNFLTSFLPPLDGTAFDWSNITANLVSIIVCVAVAALIIILTIKTGFSKSVKYASFLNIAIVIMLAVSFFSTIVTTDIFKPKDFILTSTRKNLNSASNDKNFMILLADAVDATQFNKIVSDNPEYQDILKDFSYFPDTLSGYAFTRDSIPFIFSGEWNENQTSFSEYSTRAFDNSAFFAKLDEKNYNKNFYEEELVWNSKKATDFDNVQPTARVILKKALLKQEIKYLSYKYLPFPLKAFSGIDTLNFLSTRPENDNYYWFDVDFYHNLDFPIEKIDEKYFQFVHIEGGHVPFDVDENVNIIQDDKGTYPQKLEATMKIVSAYINRLKENNAYDNSVIIIMADHGFQYDGSNRAHPMLYIKGINEHHHKMLVSDKQVSYEDICETFVDLLSDKKSTEIFTEIPNSGRTRRYISNPFRLEEHMEEYELNGNAWDADALKPTGKVFDLWYS